MIGDEKTDPAWLPAGKPRILQCMSAHEPKRLWTSVGSANFDHRSLSLNDEASLNVSDREFAAGETRAFDRDLERAHETTHEEWRRRPAWQKATDSAAALLRSQL